MLGLKKLISSLLAVCCIKAAYCMKDGDPSGRSLDTSSLNMDELLTEGFKIAGRKRVYQQNVIKTYDKTHDHERIWGSVKRAKPSTARMASCQGSGTLETARLIAERQNLTKEDSMSLTSIRIPQDRLDELTADCRRSAYGGSGGGPSHGSTENCLQNRYRTASGVCNNPKHFTWGASLEPFQRLAPADYEDGIDTPRGFSTLPNPRTISLALKARDEPPPSQKVSQMLKTWGQLLDHDIVFTPEQTAGVSEDGETIDLPCCDEGDYETVHFEDCLPIPTPPHDIFFRDADIQCLRFVRALPFSGGVVLRHREQFTEITSFIDGSNVYGSSDEEQEDLRTHEGGLLRAGEGQESTCTSTCPLQYLVESHEPEGENHFLAGDARVNEQPSLASIHTIWLRFHNLLAERLNQRFKNDDEIIFQETRKVVGAIMQHITYTEFLPVVLGPKFLYYNGLETPSPQNQDEFGYETRYDVHLNPGVFNVFGAAAMRFGHTLITNDMAGIEPFKLQENFFNAILLRDSDAHPSDILENEFLSNAEGVDAVFDTVLTNLLLAREPFTHGNDLMALNIMRGRDHGIPGYNRWRKACGLRPFRTFEEMTKELDPFVVKVFASEYKYVDDIDLFPAGLAEFPVYDGILGPTFSCIMLQQFAHLKFGDRFWYENGPRVHFSRGTALTPHVLGVVRRFSLAYVLCLTTSIKEVSRRPMEVPGPGNEIVSCREVLGTNLIGSLTSRRF